LAICHLLWLIGIFFSRFGMLYQEKSGNSVSDPRRQSGAELAHVAFAHLVTDGKGPMLRFLKSFRQKYRRKIWRF
jgi:hypothetical protein